MDEHEQRTAPSELSVVGVRVELPSQQPIVLLKEVAGDRYLPIWIGAVEATAIAFAQQGVTPPRPLTHDLMKDVLEATGQRLDEVRIIDMQDGVFFAQLVFDGGAEVGARPKSEMEIGPLRQGRPPWIDHHDFGAARHACRNAPHSDRSCGRNLHRSPG